MTERIKYFSPAKAPAWAMPDAFYLDENGIPQVAWDNTEGDTPVKAEQLVNFFAYKVTYIPDEELLTAPPLPAEQQ